MNQRDYFELGSKLIGLYCLVIALPLFPGSVFYLFSDPRYAGEKDKDLLLAAVSILTPLILAALGIYLLKKGALIHKMAFPASRDDVHPSLAASFNVAVKLYGVYMIVRSLPTLSRRFSNYIWVGDPSDPYNTRAITVEAFGINTDFVSMLINITIGICLLTMGHALIAFAFPEATKEEQSV